jgi:hypothetical protein
MAEELEQAEPEVPRFRVVEVDRFCRKLRILQDAAGSGLRRRFNMKLRRERH